MLLCRCSCGREGLYSSALTKPTYKGRRKCAHCAGRPCEVCGAWMPAKPGMQAATCSVACRKLRAARLESERYTRVKGTDEWARVRRAYLETIQARRADPAFDAAFRLAGAQATARHTARINADPASREAYLRRKRAIWAAWWAALIADPARHADYRERCREWYRSLSPEDRARIYYAPRKKPAG